VDEVTKEEDFDDQAGAPMMKESYEDDTTYTTKRSKTTLTRLG
jgi:hypothetical protein